MAMIQAPPSPLNTQNSYEKTVLKMAPPCSLMHFIQPVTFNSNVLERSEVYKSEVFSVLLMFFCMK